MRLGIAAIFKNENAFVLEWLAYHRVIGFDYFIVSDNESTDGTRELLYALQTLDLLTLIDVRSVEGQRPQLPSYTNMLSKCPSDVDCLAFIDADEFIVPMGAESVVPTIEKLFSNPQVGAVAMNWATFGSSGEVFAEDGLVIDRFRSRAREGFGVNNHYKTIVRPRRASEFVNPHHVKLTGGQYVDSCGIAIVPHEKHGLGLTQQVLWSNLRVNHYVVKSLEEFLIGKSRNGSASKTSRVKHKSYFLGHDRNEEHCEEIVKFIPAVKLEISRIVSMLEALPPTRGDGLADTFFGT